jgi:hypothetical protein
MTQPVVAFPAAAEQAVRSAREATSRDPGGQEAATALAASTLGRIGGVAGMIGVIGRSGARRAGLGSSGTVSGQGMRVRA